MVRTLALVASLPSLAWVAACASPAPEAPAPPPDPRPAEVVAVLAGGASERLAQAVINLRGLHLIGEGATPRVAFLRESSPIALDLLAAPGSVVAGPVAVPAGRYVGAVAVLHGAWLEDLSGGLFAAAEGPGPPPWRLRGRLELAARTPALFEVRLPDGGITLEPGRSLALALGLEVDTAFAPLTEPARWALAPRLEAVPLADTATLTVTVTGLERVPPELRGACAVVARGGRGALVARRALAPEVHLARLFPHAGPFTAALAGPCAAGPAEPAALAPGESARRTLELTPPDP